MRRHAAVGVVPILLVTLLTAVGARADHCSTKLEIWSTVGKDAAVAPAAPGTQSIECSPGVPRQENVGTRVIVPGATHLGAGYAADFGASWPTLRLVVDGLGFEDRQLSLARTDSAGQFVYVGGYWAIPNGPVLSGSLTATIYLPSGPQSIVYRTAA